MPRLKRARAYSKSRRPVFRRGRKGPFAKKKWPIGGRKRRVIRRRRYVKRGGARRRSHRKGYSTSFEQKLLKAEGQRFRFNKVIQCEFAVPFAKLIGTVNQEPTAQYMWPRQIGAGENNGGFYTPATQNDMLNMMDFIFGTGWYTTQTSEVWDSNFTMSWKARYEVVNITNIPVRYEVERWKIMKDVPYVAGGASSQNTLNPLTLAGQYLYSTGDTTALSNQDAGNTGLHTIRNQLSANKAWTNWYTRTSKKTFTLQPGKMKAHTISRKTYTQRLVDNYPNILVNQIVSPTPLFCRRKGDSFLLYKMLSEPADVNDVIADPLQETSTRTTPKSVLSYQCQYTVLKPNVRKQTAFIPLPTLGYNTTTLTMADIAVMADSDFKEAPETVAG